jgi:hypothetical protein
MVIEYIKRGQKLGYEGDTLVYKVPLNEQAPAIEPPVEQPAPEAPVEEEAVVLPE